MSQQEDEEKIDLAPELVTDIVMWADTTGGTKDPVAKLLRLHALTEFYLNRALALHLDLPDLVIDDSKFSYYHKRVLAKSLGALPDRVIESIKRLSALRNKCAHSPLPKFSAEEILFAAEPIRIAYDNAIADHVKDGMNMNELSAYSWAIFSEMTLAISPREIVRNRSVAP